VSNLSIKRLQVGNSTAGNNFVIRQPDTADATLRISNGNIGTTTDLVTINSSGSVGVGTIAPKTKLQSSGAAQTNVPTLGVVTGAGLYVTNTDDAYGLMAGVSSNGNSWLQVQRTDGSATAYNLNLQPSGGNVGIANSAPLCKLDITQPNNSEGDTALRVYANNRSVYTGLSFNSVSSTYYLRLQAGINHYLTLETNNLERVRVESSGNVNMKAALGVGTTTYGTTGEIRATNNITAFFASDQRFKTNIHPIVDALGIVAAVGGKTFDWTDEYLQSHGGEDTYFMQKSDFGIIAQDIQKVFPQAVRTRPDGTLAVDYEKLVAVAFQAIVELNDQIETLKKAR